MSDSQHSEGNLLQLEIAKYKPPEGATDMADRQLEGSSQRVILYVGNLAILDIVHIDEEARPDYLIMRLEEDV